eukprot:2987518-Rhodomonas_salina.1
MLAKVLNGLHGFVELEDEKEQAAKGSECAISMLEVVCEYMLTPSEEDQQGSYFHMRIANS